jgi:hypothetical protein
MGPPIKVRGSGSQRMSRTQTTPSNLTYLTARFFSITTRRSRAIVS